MTKVTTLGAGMVGSAMAMDMATDSELEVTVADVREHALDRVAGAYGVRTRPANLADPAVVRELVGDYDIVLGALSSVIGLQTLRAVIEAGKPYCDIAFMAEDATELSVLARERGVTAVVDCGVAPGMSNMLAGHAANVLDPCERIEIYVGGLPVERRWPFEYKAGFAPHDVIEEYVRPSRVVEGGRIVVKEALSEPELLDFPGIGTLEAFNTDGLRTLADTIDAPNMKEKTLRYPGHIDLMRAMRDTGLFSKEPVEVNGVSVVPLELTSKLLFPLWTYEEGEADLTVMRIFGEARGARVQWDVYDELDPSVNTTSMARTTAFPAAIVARMLADGTIAEPGVHAPEAFAGRDDIVQRLLSELGERGVRYERTKTSI